MITKKYKRELSDYQRAQAKISALYCVKNYISDILAHNDRKKTTVKDIYIYVNLAIEYLERPPRNNNGV